MEVPVCRKHPGSRVVRAGWYGEYPRRRQRWRCIPQQGSSHRFSEDLPRREARKARCEVCTTKLEEWEGQDAAREYTFAARQIARALTDLAKGATYQDAGEEARRFGQMLKRNVYVMPCGRLRNPDRDGQVAANWADAFADVAAGPYMPTEWPERLAVDSVGFAATNHAHRRAGMRFNFLVAVGYESGERLGRVWRIEPSARKGYRDWERFFDALDSAPASITSDDDSSIARAIASRFPGSEHRLCEEHLMQRLRSRIATSLLRQPQHPVMKLLPYALSSEGGWDRFKQAALDEYHHGNPRLVNSTLRWIRVWDSRLLAQLRTRTYLGPNSTGAVEGVNNKLRTYFPKRRASCMTNLARAQKLSLLLQCGFNAEADELEWGEWIRIFLEQYRGRPLKQRSFDDPSGYWSLLV